MLIEAPYHPTSPALKRKEQKKSLGNQGINVKRHATNNQNFILGTLKSIRAAPQNEVNLESKQCNIGDCEFDDLATRSPQFWQCGVGNYGNVELTICQ